MKLRILLIAAAVMVSGLALAPMATAQAPPNYYTVKLEWAHPDMPVPDTGRADMELAATLEATGFVCPQACKISVELKLDSFAKWAGSSLEPFTATFEIPQGQPGTTVTNYESKEDIKLNLAWDLETAPRTGASQIYVVSTGKYAVEGTPITNPSPRPAKSAPMTATLPDRPAEVNSTVAPDCASDPFNPACANLATTAPAESPAIDAGILLASLAVFAVVLRRRRA